MREAASQSFEDDLLEGIQDELERVWDKEKDDDDEEKEKLEPVDLKKTMIFVIPLRSKQASVVEVAIKD